jgi:IS30 family transposase
MKIYKQLTQEQRYQIYILMKTNHKQFEIAMLLGVHKSTISRELRRNRGLKGYRPKQAHNKAINRRSHKSLRRISLSTWALVKHLVKNDWSPEQISAWLKLQCDIRVSHEAVYQYILSDKKAGGSLYKHLRCQRKRKKRYGSYQRRGQIVNRISIDDRPTIVDSRSRIGDWEVDTIIGKGHKQAIVSLTERRAKLSLIRKVEHKTASAVGQAVIELLRPLSGKVHTITSDNGKEFADHKQIAKSLHTDFYFAHPYSSWERGTNENTNGLIRQYFSKNRNFSTITEEEVNLVMDKLNNRPRKSLGFKTPNQIFYNHNQVALTS